MKKNLKALIYIGVIIVTNLSAISLVLLAEPTKNNKSTTLLKKPSGNHEPTPKKNPSNDPLKTSFRNITSFLGVNGDDPNDPFNISFRVAFCSALCSPIRVLSREQGTIKILGQIYENILKNATTTAKVEFLRFYKDQKPPDLFKITKAFGNLSAIPSILKQNQKFLLSCSTKQVPSFAMVFF
ncbi:hypothetical protein CL657_03285 [bacterium]|nr:hypothetical protein [bacterium]